MSVFSNVLRQALCKSSLFNPKHENCGCNETTLSFVFSLKSFSESAREMPPVWTIGHGHDDRSFLQASPNRFEKRYLVKKTYNLPFSPFS